MTKTQLKKTIDLLKTLKITHKLPILEIARITNGDLIATNLDETLIIKTDLDNCTFNYKTFCKIKDLELAKTQNQLSEFTELPEIVETDGVNFGIDWITNIFELKGYTSTDFIRASGLTGVCIDFDNSNICATSGHVLITKKFNNTENIKGRYIIPATVFNICSIVTVTKAELFDKTLVLSFEEGKYLCNLIDGKYPNYLDVIPEKTEHTLDIVDVKEFLSITEKLKVLTSVSRTIVIEKGKISVKHKATNEKVSIETNCFTLDNDNVMPICFNSDYLKLGLKNVNNNSFVFGFGFNSNSAKYKLKPLLYKSSDTIILIMPMFCPFEY